MLWPVRESTVPRATRWIERATSRSVGLRIHSAQTTALSWVPNRSSTICSPVSLQRAMRVQWLGRHIPSAGGTSCPSARISRCRGQSWRESPIWIASGKPHWLPEIVFMCGPCSIGSSACNGRRSRSSNRWLRGSSGMGWWSLPSIEFGWVGEPSLGGRR